ncbi:MAG: type II toxin-antitoxin system VapC family toxin [Stackebrandtia sp.]
MIVLDTNVVSEVIGPRPDKHVVSWVHSCVVTQTYITSVTAAELLYGVAKLPQGRRKDMLAEKVQNMLRDAYDGRIEPFDVAAAGHYAMIVASREGKGRPIEVADAQIAAICRKHGATLATRNAKDFEGTGVEVVNPWEAD